jgi:hypothetical protein
MAYWLMDSPINHISQVPAGSAPMDLTTSSWQLAGIAGIPERIGKAVGFGVDFIQTL